MKILVINFIIFAISTFSFGQSSIVFELNTSINIDTDCDICADVITINGSYSGSGTQCLSPLPVELTTFTANVNENKVVLNWQTATEVNNYGFEIERSQTSNVKSETWEKIGFVEGHGNSNSPKDYTFTENLLNLSLGLNLKYRLKQLDFDGNYEYSDEITVELGELVKEYKLEQNYPNPFNPSTEIKFSIPQNSNVKLELFNMLGEKVATLINQEMTAGSHNYQLSIINYQLSSGIYLYKLQSGNFVQTRKLMLIK